MKQGQSHEGHVVRYDTNDVLRWITGVILPVDAGATCTTNASQSSTTYASTKAQTPGNAVDAHWFFANQNREEVREQNPDLKPHEIGKILGNRWQALSLQDREPYTEMAKHAKEEWERERGFYAEGG